MTYEEIMNERRAQFAAQEKSLGLDKQRESQIEREREMLQNFEATGNIEDIAGSGALQKFLTEYNPTEYSTQIKKIHEKGFTLEEISSLPSQGYAWDTLGFKKDTEFAVDEVAEAKQEVLDYLEGGGGTAETRSGDVQAGSSGSITRKRQNQGGLFGRYTTQDNKRNTLLG